MTSPRIVPCPHCGKAVEWSVASRSRPFCSERCKLIDLGAWASEAYRVPAADLPESSEAPPTEPERDTPSRR